MNRIEVCLQRLRKQRRKALLTFITAGDPDLKTTHNLVLALERAGTDIIELGVPFSDPMADGPVIQAASERALKKGTTLKKVLSLVQSLRRKTQMPILLMGYYNPIFVMGLKEFAHRASQSGVDGVLVVDLPPEEARPLAVALRSKKISLIHLLAPTSDAVRIKKVVRNATGFIYYVSMTGVTGGQLGQKAAMVEMQKQIARIRRATKLPLMIGFGISTPLMAATVAVIGDGIVVGSALIATIDRQRSSNSRLRAAEKFVSSLKKAI